MNNKIAILMLSSSTYPSLRNSKIQKKVFFNQENKLQDVYWYKQGSDKVLKNLDYFREGKDLWINADDSSLGMGEKTLLAFEWLLNNSDFEYLFRTNTSSYVSIKNLINYIEENFEEKKFVYSGLIHETNDLNGEKIQFASGSGFLLNRSVVEVILDNKNLWNHDYWDDVSLGLMLRELNIPLTNGKRFDITGNVFNQHIDLNQYHYRCRIDNHFGYPRFLEYYVISYLNSLELSKRHSKLKINMMSYLFEVCKFFYIQQFTWKLFLIFRKVLYKILPKKFYNQLKFTFKKSLRSFKLKRFKI